MTTTYRAAVRFFAVFFLFAGITAGGAGEVLSEDPGIGGRFLLRDHNGRIVTDSDFPGQYLLVYFGYTFCPDICPTSLGTITQAMELLGPEAEKVTPLFITVDPERDTAMQLWEYVQHFHPRLVALTGPTEMISRIAKAYKVRYEKIQLPGSDPGTYTIDHSAGVFLMGPDGKFRVKMAHGIPPEQMADRIKDFF